MLTFKRKGDQVCHLGCQGTFKHKGFSRRQPGPYPERGAPGVSPHAAISYNKKTSREVSITNTRCLRHFHGAQKYFASPWRESHSIQRGFAERSQHFPPPLQPWNPQELLQTPTHSGRKEERGKLSHVHPPPPPPPPHSLLLAFSRMSKQQVLQPSPAPNPSQKDERSAASSALEKISGETLFFLQALCKHGHRGASQKGAGTVSGGNGALSPWECRNRSRSV